MEEAGETIRRYRCGDFVIDERRGVLQRHGQDVPLRPKTWGVLRQLVLHRGELVTKQALLDAVWRRRIVSEGVVAKSVREIREALGDDHRAVVRTVPGRGYIFDAPVTLEATADDGRDEPGASPAALETDPAADGIPATPMDSSVPPVSPVSRTDMPAAHRWRHASLGLLLLLVVAVVSSVVPRTDDSSPRPLEGSAFAPRERSIAVLPFEDMSPEGDQQYLADGMAEEILNLLAASEELTVIARTSSFAFREEQADVRTIGRRLDVAYLIEGSVRRSGDDLRVAVQLVDTRDGTRAWSASYDRKTRDTLRLQSEIAGAVSDQLHVRLVDSGDRPPVDPVAYQRYMEARFLFNRRSDGDLARAEALYLEATRLDPDFARAWAGLAGVYWVRTTLWYEDSIRLSMPEALDAMALPVERALQADPDLAEAHVRAFIYFTGTGDPARARDHLARARALAPNDPLVLASLAWPVGGSEPLESQIAVQRKIIAVDPLSLTPRYNLVHHLILERLLVEARREIEAALSLFPEATGRFAYQSALIDLLEGDFEAAAAAAEKLPDETDRLYEKTGLLAAVWDAQGLTDRTAGVLAQLEQEPDGWAALRLAEIHAYRGAEDEAFAWLREALQRAARDPDQGNGFWQVISESLFLVELEADPRWHALHADAEA